MSLKINIIGDGAMGTALGILLCNKGHKVNIWGAFPEYVKEVDEKRINRKFLPGVSIPREIRYIIDSNIEEADLTVIAVPTQYIRGVLGKLNLNNSKYILSVAKGIEENTGKLPSQIIGEFLKRDDIVILSGPSHAEEIVRCLPTSVVVASKSIDNAKKIQSILTTPFFRIYTGEDMLGVELGGALKNIIGIAAGICDGLGFGDNSKAALITRGIAEITRLGVAMGSKSETFSGLSGIGDVITTCFSPHGRNRWLGDKIGQGEKLEDVLTSTEQVVEGVWTTREALRLAKKYNVEMPITKEVYNILFDNKDPKQAVIDLMTRGLKSEF